jgi:hypothetical protein
VTDRAAHDRAASGCAGVPPTYVFVMGRGHSGSTVLDSLLSNAACSTGIGGIVAGMQDPGAVCSCGEPVSRCAFWEGVRVRFEASTGLAWGEAARELREQADLSSFIPTLFARRRAPWVRRRKAVIEGIADAVRETTDRNVVVDSSKALPVALFVARFVEGSRLVHLVRDPERVLASNYHRIREGAGLYFMGRRLRDRRFTAFYVALGALAWVVGNLLAEVTGRLAPGRVRRLRYEDLCSDTPARLLDLGRFLGTDVSGVISATSRGEALPVGHKSAGNRMRMSGEFVWDPKRAGGRPLPAVYRWIVRVVAWPLMWVYGYLRRS